MASIILVPGACHQAKIWDRLCDHLKKTGYTGRHTKIELPSVGADSGSPATLSMDPDIDCIHKTIVKELAESTSVLLVTHSYGSVPTNEALQPFANQGRIKHFIIAGFLLDADQSTFTLCGSVPPPLWDVQGEFIYVKDPVKHFYNDLSKDLQEELFTDLRSQSTATQHQPVSWKAWSVVPTTYMYCEQDNAIPAPFAEMMIQMARNQGAKLDIRKCSTGHSVIVSRPDLVVEIIYELLA